MWESFRDYDIYGFMLSLATTNHHKQVIELCAAVDIKAMGILLKIRKIVVWKIKVICEFNFNNFLIWNRSHLEISNSAKIINPMCIDKSKHELNTLIFFSFSL